jgi:hypothetical protein
LHATTKTENQVQSRFLLNVIVGESAAILELLASENQALLVRRDALLILNLRLDIVNSVAGLDLQGDGLARESLDEDLHGEDDVRSVSVCFVKNDDDGVFNSRRKIVRR